MSHAAPTAASRLTTLLMAAVRAPSGDNTQPWSLLVDADTGRVGLAVDPARDPSPMNAGQRMARLAIGAALENILTTAARNGWKVDPIPASPPAITAVLVGEPNAPGGAIDPVLLGRVSNRRPFDGRPVPAGLVETLARAAPELEGVRTMWLSDRPRIAALAAVVARADALMFGERTMRQAFLGNVRFDAPVDAEVAEGLSLASLELSAADRIALRLMQRSPHWLVKYGGALRVFAGHARRLVASASGLCLVIAADDREATDLVVGRALQRAWLALTAAGLAVQPMMSLPVLENVQRHGRVALQGTLDADQLAAIQRDFRRLVPELGAGRPAFLLRFGYALPPSGRTGRRPLVDVIQPASGVCQA